MNAGVVSPPTAAAPARSLRWALWPWWLAAPLALHCAFSWIGFNPTDEGWLQAVARRLADGAVPHRDFIFVRPALSALLQVPLVWWGGDHVLWLARAWGWLTLAASCWVWTGLVGARGLARHLVYLAALLAGAHTFPIMAWHTLDGLLLATLGVWAAQRGRFAAAFILVGAAALCRQNFALFGPVLALALGLDGRRWVLAGLWTCLPLALYVGALAALGGAGEFFTQASAVRGALLPAAFGAWLKAPQLWLGLALGAAVWFAQRRGLRGFGPWIFVAALGALAVQLGRSPAAFTTATFALAGLVALTAAARGERFLGVAGVGLAWVVSISSGYNFPALAAGVLVALLARTTLDLAAPQPTRATLGAAALAVLALAAAFIPARLRWPYCDRPAEKLTWDAGDALPGARGLRTNPVTVASLAELRLLVDGAAPAGGPVVVLTDYSAFWIRAPERNPLLVEWAQETELGDDEALLARVRAQLQALPPTARVVAHKFFVPGYGIGLVSLEDVAQQTGRYRLQREIARSWRVVADGRYFTVYAPPAR